MNLKRKPILEKAKSLENEPGFTLIELLVVIAIIALLASVVFLGLNSARQKSRDVKRIADMNQMSKALELYYNDNFAYPTGTDGILSSVSAPGLTNKYITNYPVAPTPADNPTGLSTCTGAAQGNNVYWYEGSVSVGTTYTITFCLGATTGGLAPGTRTLTPGGFK